MPALGDWIRRRLNQRERSQTGRQGGFGGPMLKFDDAHALIVGVGADLPNTVDDATAMRDILIDPGRCGYNPKNVELLTKDSATRDGFADAMKHLAANAGPESSVVIYFSGHGTYTNTPDGPRYYLLPFGYNLSSLGSTSISGEEFVTSLDRIKAKKILLILDCCHAGGFSVQAGPEFKSAPLPASEEVLAAGAGRILIASSKANEVSLAGNPYSCFTTALLEGLSGCGASSLDGYVRAADLALYTNRAVTKRTGDRQHPILHFSKADNFAVAYYAGGDTQVKAPPVQAPPLVDDERDVPAPAPVFNQVGWIVGTVNNSAAPVNVDKTDRRNGGEVS